MKYLNTDVLGYMLWRKRRDLKLSQKDMANILKVSFRTIYNREKNPDNWTMGELKRMAIALDVDPVELMRTATKEI